MSSKDQRIVELQFDNKSFEAGVDSTLKSIEGLKKSLNFNSVSMDGLQKSINGLDFGNLADNIESISSRFSNLGIIGMSVLDNIGDAIWNAGKKLADSTIGQILTGGKKRSLNIEHAKFMFKGLGMDIETAMANANAAVEGTAFGLDEAAVATATLGASGISLGDQMEHTLKGISGVAAMTGREYSNIADIFSKIASNGVIMTQEARQFSAAGLNVAADLAKALGTTEAVVYDMFSKKQISSDFFFETMFEKYWELAESANDTWQGSVSNLKTALSRIGQPFYDSIYGNGREAVNNLRLLLNSFKSNALGPLYDWFDSKVKIVSSSLQEVFKSLTDKLNSNPEAALKVISSITNILEGLWNILKSIGGVLQVIGGAFKRVFPQSIIDLIYNITDKFKSFTQTLSNGIQLFNRNGQSIDGLSGKFKGISTVIDKVKRIFQGFFAIFDIAYRVIQPIVTLLWNFIKGPIGSIANFILSIAAVIGDLLVAIDDFLKKTDIINWALSKISPLLNFISTGISFLIDKLTSLIDKVRIATPDSLIAYIENVKTKVDELTSKIANLFKSTGDSGTFTKILSKLKSIFEKIGGALSKVGQKIKELFANVSLDDVLKAFIGGASGGLIITISKLVSNISKSIRSFSSIGDAIREIFGGVTDYLKALQEQVKAQIISEIAKAVLMLAGACLMMSFIDKDKLFPILGGVTALLGEMIGMMLLISRYTSKMESSSDGKGIIGFLKPFQEAFVQNIKLGGLTTSMIKMAGALVILAKALSIIGKLQWDEIAKGITGLTAVMALMIAAMKVMKKFEIDNTWVGNFKTAAFAMIEVSLSMLIFAQAAKMFGSLDWESLGKAIASMGILMISMGAFSKLTANQGPNLIAASGAMIIMGLALTEFAGVLMLYSLINWGIVIDSLAKIGAALIIIAGFSKMVDGLNFLKAAALMTTFAISLTVLEAALLLYALIDWMTFISGLGKVIGILATIVGFSRLIKADDLFKTIPGILAFGLALGELAIALLIFNSVNWTSIPKAVITLGTLIATLIIFQKSIDPSQMKQLSKSLLAFSGAMALLGIYFLAFSLIPFSAVLSGLLAIAGTLAVLAVSAKLIQPLIPAMDALVDVLYKFSKAIGLIGIGVAAFAIGITLLLKLLASLSTSIEESMAQLAHAAAVFLIDLVKELTAMIPQMVESLFTMIIQLLDQLIVYVPQMVDKIVNLIIQIFHALTPRVPELITAAVEFLSVLFDSFLTAIAGKEEAFIAAIMGIIATVIALSQIPITGVLKAVAAIGIIAGALVALLTAFGLLMKIPGIEQILSDGVTVFETIGKAIGGFIGGIVGGIAEGVASALPKIGMYLSAFAINATPFFALMSNIDNKIFDGVDALANAILKLTASNLLDAIANFLGGNTSFARFGEELSAFARGLTGFAKEVSTLSSDEIDAMYKAAQASEALTQIHPPNEGGLLAEIVGENTLDTFGERLAAYGKGLVSFATSIRLLTEEDISKIEIVAKASEALTQIHPPNEGGLIALIIGDNTLDTFGERLAVYGKGLVSFAMSIRLLTEDDISKIETVASISQALTEISPPNEGGFISWIVGDNTLANFGDNLEQYGAGLVRFSTSLKLLQDSDLDSMERVASISKTLTEISPPSEGGLLNWLSGNTSLSDFGTNLEDYGKSISLFAVAVRGVTEEDIANMRHIASISRLLTAIDPPKEGGLISKLMGDSSLSNFGTNLEDYGKSIKSFAIAVRGITESDSSKMRWVASISQALTAIDPPKEGGLISALMGDSSLSNFGTNLESYGDSISAFAESVRGIEEGDISTMETVASISNELAKIEPPTEGGLMAKIMGEKSLSTFGDNLESYGDSLANFVTSIKGVGTINKTNIDNVIDVSNKLASIEVPSDGGFFGTLFGNTSLGNFGSNLEQFGNGLANFVNSIKDISFDYTKYSEINNLISIITKMEGLDTSSASSNFSQSLNNIGTEGITGFTNALSAAKTQIQTTINELISIIVAKFSSAKPSISAAGSGLGTSFVTGLRTGLNTARTAVSWSIQSVFSYLRSCYSTMRSIGSELGSSLESGFRSNSYLYSAASSAISSATAALNMYWTFFNIGQNNMQGFINGMANKAGAVYQTAYNLGRSAVDAAKAAADQSSPSKEFFKIGAFNGQGLINGTLSMKDKVISTYTDLSSSTIQTVAQAINKINDYINSGVDANPVIRPILDLSSVDDNIGSLNSLFGNPYMNLSTSRRLAAAVDYNGSIPVETVAPKQDIINNNYTQNITSPKPVSRYEIYRDTKNLLSIKQGRA